MLATFRELTGGATKSCGSCVNLVVVVVVVVVGVGGLALWLVLRIMMTLLKLVGMQLRRVLQKSLLLLL